MKLSQLQKESASLIYTPALDGMRGIAIVAVMAFHAELSFIPGGFIGVDVFFVLSGFLITVLLVREFDRRDAVNLKNFYMRRVLRLAPALLLLLVVFSALSVVFLDWESARSNLIDSLIALFYSANWARAFQVHPPDYLGHTWSLSIEEQFYILWPAMLLILLHRVKSRWRVAAIIFVMALMAWLLRIVLVFSGASIYRLYNGLDTRADALLVGCALGVVLASDLLSENRRDKWRDALRYLVPQSLFGLLVVCLFVHWTNPHLYLWIYFLVELMAAVLILDVFISDRSMLKSMLSWRGIVWIGGISYGLYLWHYPIYRSLMALGKSDAVVVIGGTVLTFVAAVASYYLIERPFLGMKRRYK